MFYVLVVIGTLLLSAFSVGCISDISQNKLIQQELFPDHLFSKFKNRSVEGSLREIFEKINVVRSIGSPGHVVVREFIKKFLEERGWHVELDTFKENTIIGPKVFHNIVGYKNKSTYSKFLILACHYESKMIRNFVGSTDSAMPCSMILKIVDLLNNGIDLIKNSSIGLKVVFFDGEEAFEEWTDTDSLYGSRHLAAKWSEKSSSSGETELSKIDLFVLLDLLGAANPQIPDFRYEKRGSYVLLSTLEKKMRSLNLLKSFGPYKGPFFGSRLDQIISDDHLPFLKREEAPKIGLPSGEHRENRGDGDSWLTATGTTTDNNQPA
uniref:glutaminyl-peptide cyclotransferase n=1 Tax=Trichobilharzia regenti TaxID=157069 RepID=A0AA85JS23_TRIRE|nr:unnamed protein product [Trichobilharzia regenti]